MKKRRSKARIQDIDWSDLDPLSLDSGANVHPVVLQPMNLSLKIQNQQPRPTPRMELPWSTGGTNVRPP